MPSTAILLLKATPAWQELPEAERMRIRRRSVSMALRDGETFEFLPPLRTGAGATDVAVVGATEADGWLHAYDRLRESELLDLPWFRIVGVLPEEMPARQVEPLRA